jgi:thiol-disulfide isomerase/thioredoxin
MIRRATLWAVAVCVPLGAQVVSEIRYKLSAGDLLSAEALADEYYRANGGNAEYAAALGWLARGALMLQQPDLTERYVAEIKSLTGELLKSETVDDDEYLASAVGAQIEVEAKLLVRRGEREKAIALLEHELPRWKKYSMRARIQKNINLLTLVGKAAPVPVTQYRGRTVLLFLWAHWCSDCKRQAPVIARIRQKYESRDLVVLAPTRLYGVVPKVEHPSEKLESEQVESVWKESYSGLDDVAHPISDPMMLAYGVSSTPTLVLIDKNGLVRMYEPFRMSDRALSERIDAMLGK